MKNNKARKNLPIKNKVPAPKKTKFENPGTAKIKNPPVKHINDLLKKAIGAMIPEIQKEIQADMQKSSSEPEEYKLSGGRRYSFNKWHSGGVDGAQIVSSGPDGWKTHYDKSGSDSWKGAQNHWNSIKPDDMPKTPGIQKGWTDVARGLGRAALPAMGKVGTKIGPSAGKFMAEAAPHLERATRAAKPYLKTAAASAAPAIGMAVGDRIGRMIRGKSADKATLTPNVKKVAPLIPAAMAVARPLIAGAGKMAAKNAMPASIGFGVGSAMNKCKVNKGVIGAGIGAGIGGLAAGPVGAMAGGAMGSALNKGCDKSKKHTKEAIKAKKEIEAKIPSKNIEKADKVKIPPMKQSAVNYALKNNVKKYPLYGKKLTPATTYQTENHAIEGVKKGTIGAGVGAGLGGVAGGAIGGPVGAGLGAAAGGMIGANIGKKKNQMQKSLKKAYLKEDNSKLTSSTTKTLRENGEFEEETTSTLRRKEQNMETSDLDMAKAQAQASLGVQKAIFNLQGYEPMSDDLVKKSFNGRIPDVMKNVETRPPQIWWAKALSKASVFDNNPIKYSMDLWYGNINKAVAEPLDSKCSPKKTGEDEQISDGTRVDITSITGKGKSESDESL